MKSLKNIITKISTQFVHKIITYNPMQNILRNIKKSGKTRQDWLTFVSVFVYSLTVSAKMFSYEGGD